MNRFSRKLLVSPLTCNAICTQPSSNPCAPFVPILNARAQVVVWNKRKVCTRPTSKHETRLSSKWSEHRNPDACCCQTRALTCKFSSCFGTGCFARCKPRLNTGALIAATTNVTMLPRGVQSEQTRGEKHKRRRQIT